MTREQKFLIVLNWMTNDVDCCDEVLSSCKENVLLNRCTNVKVRKLDWFSSEEDCPLTRHLWKKLLLEEEPEIVATAGSNRCCASKRAGKEVQDNNNDLQNKDSESLHECVSEEESFKWRSSDLVDFNHVRLLLAADGSVAALLVLLCLLA